MRVAFFITLFMLVWMVSCRNQHNPSSVKGIKDLPNILWITCEDLMPMLHCYGDAYAHTPNLDLLASQGALYRNAFATAPVCSPARSALATGVYASSLGSQHLRSEINKPAFIRTLPAILKSEGYYCTNNDKEDYNFMDTTMWHESSKTAHWKNRPDPDQPFFSVFNLGTTHQSQIFGTDEVFEEKYGRQLEPKLRHDPSKAPVPPYYFDTPLIRKMLARYYDLVTIMDRQVGEILAELEADGLSENTLVFFYADHGTGLPRGKRTLYDSGIKVPLIIKAPEPYATRLGIRPNSEIKDLVSFIDFPPTVLNILDMDIPEYMQGQPFLGNEIPPSRAYIYATSDRVDEAFEVSRAVRSKDFLYIRNYLPHLPLIQDNFYTDQSQIMQELRDRRATETLTEAQKSMWAEKRPPEELYNVHADPYQIRNVASDPAYTETLRQMREAHLAWVTRTYDTGLMPEPLMHKLAADSSIYQMTKNENLFPLDKILLATEASSRNDVQTLEEYLKDDHALVRYWAAVGVGHQPETFSPAITDGLKLLLNNQPDYLRLAALGSLCELGLCGAEDFVVIKEVFMEGDEMSKLIAARTFELYGNFVRAYSVHDDIYNYTQDLQKRVEGKWYGYDLYSYWALSEYFKEQ